jgi:hypothetical protein
MVEFMQRPQAPEDRKLQPDQRVEQFRTRAQRRLDVIRENAPDTTVRVKAGTYKDWRGQTYPPELIGERLKHPSGLRLRGVSATEWPNDKFTKKRIADGTLVVVE